MRSRYRCSMCPAIHITSRSWLRSSSTHEPSDPPLRVLSRSSLKDTRRRHAETGERRHGKSTVVIRRKTKTTSTRGRPTPETSTGSLNLRRTDVFAIAETTITTTSAAHPDRRQVGTGTPRDASQPCITLSSMPTRLRRLSRSAAVPNSLSVP